MMNSQKVQPSDTVLTKLFGHSTGANIGYIIYVVILCLILYFGTISLYVGQYDKKYYKDAQDTVISYTHHQKT